MRPSDDETEELARVVANHPRFIAFVRRWYDSELRRLPFAQENLQVRQGRCQALSEMLRHLDEASGDGGGNLAASTV